MFFFPPLDVFFYTDERAIVLIIIWKLFTDS